MQVDITSASVGVRPLRLKAGNTYTFSLKTTVSISNYKFVCLKYTNGEVNNIVFANIDFVNFVPKRDVENVGFILYDTVAGDKVYDVQLEMGSKATSYEPYREQLLTLPTPNGLPGIPVTSGGNYTDENGQQWVCDEVDLERGVMVQRVWKAQVNTKNGTVDEEYRIRITIDDKKGKPGDFNCIISITPYISWTSCVMGNLLYLKNVEKPDGSFYTAKELQALALDVDVVYQLATPIETPLTPAEIAAYKALTTYAPDTVVQASDGAGMEVTYKCNVRKAEKTINDLYAELTAELEA